ncbi:MAG: exodeoxyribonuclease V subunit gamma [Elusimicrobia bacterium]|nr:exodeoxyribonuclease V subunit gamma [Elusimicrobiota bacterium]
MLKVFYGPFHPDLEEAFVARLGELAACKEPVAVVAPSRLMADRLERLAAVEKDLPLLGFHFHTFHSLAWAVTEDCRGEERLISDPVFHDRVVDSLLSARPGLGRVFGGEARPRALAGALRSSLRDLMDAGVRAETVAEVFGEELVKQPEERERLESLLELGRRYEERLAELGVASPAQAVRLAAERAEASELLGSFKEVLYYGFYDLTGLQLDFFEAVCSRCPTRLYFPFRKGHPAFRFAEPFFEQKLMSHGAEAVPRPAARRPALDRALDGLFDPAAKPEAAPLTVISASGARDEAWAAAKEVLRLGENEGYSYDDIGVVARTLEPYRNAIAEVFRENDIPLHITGGEPLLRQPLAKCALNLLSLRQRDFPAEVVSDIFSSPYFRGPVPVRHWRLLIARLGIRAGWLQWRGKLEKRASGPVQLRPEEVRDGGPGWLVPQEEVSALWELVSGLREELAELPGQSWSDRARRARGLLERRLRLPEDADSRELAVWRALMAELSSLEAFDLLQEPCDAASFLETLADKLRRASLDMGSPGTGVRVRDAMDARGEGFRALILIGLKEGLFPRTVLEDPLLRDHARASLRHPAGYWIAQKAAGHEEERLLFYLMTASAKERLFCVFPRSDEAGRAQVPSLYLRELCRVAGLDFAGGAVRAVSRQPAAKLAGLEGGAASPQELVLRLALAGCGAEGRLPDTIADAGLLDAVLERASALASWGRPGPFDGLAGPPREFLKALARKGLSPSALDSFAACPFQFFAARVLDLGEPEDAARLGEVPASLRGRIYHEILERFYRGAPASLWDPEQDWGPRLEACVEAVFAERGWRETGVYPVLWQAVRAAVAENLRDFLAWDRQEALRTGLRPALFEEHLEGEAAEPRPEELAGVKFHGIADRIDRGRDGAWRVVDYKTRWSRTGDLGRLVARGRLHQLPLYAELGRRAAGGGELESACLYALEDSPEANGRPRCRLHEAQRIREDRQAFLEAVAARLRRLRAGRFPITPEDGEHGICSWCAFPALCRKSHGPSRVRAAALAAQAEAEEPRSGR